MTRALSMQVDVASLTALSHACLGCTKRDRCCCSSYEVCVSKEEIETINGVMRIAAQYCPALRTGESFANVFDEAEGGGCCIDTDEEGLCVFAYFSSGLVRCALHAAALELNVPPAAVKPSSCILWPLVLSDPPSPLLSVSDDALDFHCCRRRSAAQTDTVSSALLESIEALYGEKARGRVSSAAEKGRARTHFAI